jgi:hypothetical protein
MDERTGSQVILAGMLSLLGFVVQETTLAKLPEAASEVVVSGDATASAWIEGGRSVVFKGARGSDFECVRSLTINREGTAVAYAAKDRGNWFVVSGSWKSEAYDEVGAPVLQNTGLAFAARKGAAWVVVFDGAAGPEFDRVDFLAVSPAGDHAAYAGRRGKKSTLVSGGRRGPEFDDVRHVTFADAGRLAYVAVLDKESWIIDGNISPTPTISVVQEASTRKTSCLVGLFDATEPAALESFVTAWLDEDEVPTVEVDAKVPWKDVVEVLATCKAAGCRRVAFGPPGSREIFEVFDSVQAVAPIPGVKYSACIGSQRGPLRVYYGGWQTQEFKSIAGLVAGPNRTVAYRATEGDGWFVVKGRGFGQKVKVFKAVEGPVLSPDGARIAYAGNDGQSWRMISGDTASEPYDQVWLPRFNEDMTALVFAARKGRELRRVVLPLR